jgi:hypothetical protein
VLDIDPALYFASVYATLCAALLTTGVVKVDFKPLKQRLPRHGQNHGQNSVCSLAEKWRNTSGFLANRHLRDLDSNFQSPVAKG